MSDTPPTPSFQPALEAMEGLQSSQPLPAPVNPLQAQTAFERRARNEDYIAHAIAVSVVVGFFALAFAALLGFVDLRQSTVATAFGTVMGYAVGKIDPVLTRYFTARSQFLQRHPIEHGVTTDSPAGPPKTQ